MDHPSFITVHNLVIYLIMSFSNRIDLSRGQPHVCDNTENIILLIDTSMKSTLAYPNASTVRWIMNRAYLSLRELLSKWDLDFSRQSIEESDLNNRKCDMMLKYVR